MIRAIALSVTLAGNPGWTALIEDPMTVTTDTPEYCLSLADHMQTQGRMSSNAQMLWQDGRSLCEHGHVRRGLARLRRAMMVIRGAAE